MTHIKKIDEMVNENASNGITYFNEDKPIKIGGRKAPSGGREKLEEYEDSWDIVDYPKVKKDLSKYDFDNENLEFIDIETTETGLDFMVFETGGDWEEVLYFFVYWDGKELRGYVPTRGNAVNTLNKSAFGNDEDKDEMYCDMYGIVDYEDISDYRNLDMCIDEFTARVEVEGAPRYTPKTQVRNKHVRQKTNGSTTAISPAVFAHIKPQNPDIMVYWNVVYFREENEWVLLIDEFSGGGLSDDSNFTSKVYELIENALPEYHLSEEMESVCAIYPKDANGKHDWEKPLRTTQDAEIFAEKLQMAFPKWKRERAKRW